MLYIFCKQTSARLLYILDELLKRRIGTDYILCTDRNTFRDYEGPKINYSIEKMDGTMIHIVPHPLLFETTIVPQDLVITKDKRSIITFYTNGTGDVDFDIFSASFFLLSRYEEYLPHIPDEHGRFPHQQSIAHKHDFLEVPLVDIWCGQLKELLLEWYPSLKLKQHTFQFLSTIDIDFAYKYHGIGWKKHILKLGKSIIQFRWDDAIEHLLVVSGTKKDPYDTYSFIQKNTEEKRLPIQYFLLMRTGTLFDKNIQVTHPAFVQLVRKLHTSFKLGLHPSYFSGKEQQLEKEQILFEKYTGEKAAGNRQHFLRMKFPDTYTNLISIGITDDYSMIYSGLSGFRASTAHPFVFFNLFTNQSTNLILHPSTIMDVTLKNRHQYTPQQASAHIEKLMNEVKKVNGTFISIWHNSNLCNDKEWGPWREVFEKLHTLASIKLYKDID